MKLLKSVFAVTLLCGVVILGITYNWFGIFIGLLADHSGAQDMLIVAAWTALSVLASS